MHYLHSNERTLLSVPTSTAGIPPLLKQEFVNVFSSLLLKYDSENTSDAPTTSMKEEIIDSL